MSHLNSIFSPQRLPPSITALVFLAALGVNCLFAAAEDPLPIKAVSKWHHLLDQQKIVGTSNTGKKFTASLGIHSNQVTAGSGLVIFCVTEGFDPGKITKSQTIGPFTYRVQYEGERRLFHSLESMAFGHEIEYENCKLIFQQVIPFTKAGRATVNIYGEDKANPLAVAKVKVVENNFHRWIPFGHSQRLQLLQEADAKFDSVGYASVGTNRSAVPTIQNHRPIIYQSLDKSGKVNTHLNPMAMVSSLEPTQGKLRIGQTTDGISIVCKDKIVLSNPQSRLLARWWVNGRPYVPKSESRQFPQQITGKIVTGKKLHLICDTRPKLFGGKNTDRLEVQILYSRDGWKEFEAMEKLATYSPANSPLLLISNRLVLKTK